LLRPGQATQQDRQAEHQEDVADDRAGNRGLHQWIELRPLGKNHQGNNQLGGIAEGGVEQSAQAGPKGLGQVLGGPAHQPGQRHDGDAGTEKNRHRIGVG